MKTPFHGPGAFKIALSAVVLAVVTVGAFFSVRPVPSDSLLAPAPVPPSALRPLVIAHRGASGYLPEHTLAAYELAIEMGADFIEPDLVITKDGVLIARHENEISETTDVAEKYPERKTVKTVDGRRVEGWFSEDFTLSEIKKLRAKERLPFRDSSHNGRYEVPTFEEIIALSLRKSAETGRTIGLYPETKHPTYFNSIGRPLEDPLLLELEKAGFRDETAPVFIQSFEVSNLKDLNQRTGLRLVQLLGNPDEQPYDARSAGATTTYGQMLTQMGLRDIASYADGIGPNKRLILPESATGQLQEPTSLIPEAHAAGLLVHAWTFRNDQRFLNRAYQGDPTAEYLEFYALGADGVFSDFPDTAIHARDNLRPAAQ